MSEVLGTFHPRMDSAGRVREAEMEDGDESKSTSTVIACSELSRIYCCDRGSGSRIPAFDMRFALLIDRSDDAAPSCKRAR